MPNPNRPQPAAGGDRRWTQGLARRAGTRLAGLTVLSLLGDLATSAGTRTGGGAGGADIGLALLVVAGYVVVATAWALRDGLAGARRGEPLAGWVACWTVTAVAFGLVTAVVPSVRGVLAGGGFSLPVLLGDLLVVAPFTAVLVGPPALAAVVVTHLRRNSAAAPRGPRR